MYDQDTDYWFKHALVLHREDGYGMFTDDCFGLTEGSVIICHDCAHQLSDTIPWMNKWIQPDGGHSHSVDEMEELIEQGHVGWDLGTMNIGNMWWRIATLLNS